MEERSIEKIKVEYGVCCAELGEKTYLIGAVVLDALKLFDKLAKINQEAAQIERKKKESEAQIGKEAEPA